MFTHIEVRCPHGVRAVQIDMGEDGVQFYPPCFICEDLPTRVRRVFDSISALRILEQEKIAKLDKSSDAVLEADSKAVLLAWQSKQSTGDLQ